MTVEAPAQETSTETAATATQTSAAHEAEGAGSSRFTSAGSIPPVAHAAGAGSGASASASDRAYGGVPGGRRNIDMKAVNPNHEATVDGHPQASRVAIGGHHETRLAHRAPVYRNDGHLVGHAEAGPIQTNAGAIATIKLADASGKLATHATTCVLTHGSKPGWVPLKYFHDSGELHHIQDEVEHRIDHDRDASADLAKHGTARTVRAATAPADIEHLYTKPNQHDPGGNRATDYFVRPGDGVNVLVNLPSWTEAGGGIGERFGIAIDIAHEGSTFYETGETASIPLYHLHKTARVHSLEFVYGYVETNTGDKHLGWVPKHVLS